MGFFIPNKTNPAETRTAITDFLKSESAQLLYAACEKLCLGFMQETEELFKRAVRVSLTRIEKSYGASDGEVFISLHTEWLKFSAEKSNLKASSAALHFDWNHLEARQADNALFLLTPAEREVFIYRFLLRFSLADITRLARISGTEVIKHFHSALSKVTPA
jgi:hypothetical protein